MHKALIFGIWVGALAAHADQPPLGVEVRNDNCQDGPKMVNGKPDTVATHLDSGFVSLFNGKDLTGWWENCNTHTLDKVKGGVWIVDPAQGVLYSREEGPNGGILVTNQSYEHYEFIMDLWPTYGNDGGIFNRVTTTGKSWQTTIDYISGSGVAGSFNEGGWTSGDLNDDPFRFSGAGPSAPDVPAGTANWTNFTKNLTPVTFGCAATGCVGSDFAKIWDLNGWNQIRVKFYDGLTPGRSVTVETFLRKVGSAVWVPIYKRTMAVVTPKNPIALQIHGGGRWKAGSWNLYRNIKIRQLTIDGTPVIPDPVSVSKNQTHSSFLPVLKLSQGFLTGRLDAESDILLTDTQGRKVYAFRAGAGEMRHAIPANLRGLLFVELKNKYGVSRQRFSRVGSH